MTDFDDTGPAPRIPAPVLAWGLAGLIPFLGLPALAHALPGVAGWTDRALGLYGAIILSFLGGARWGQAIRSNPPPPRIIAMSMAPSVAAWGLVLLPGAPAPFQLAGLATGLILSWLWDVRSTDTPSWYPHLRGLLTAGAVAGLAAGALL